MKMLKKLGVLTAWFAVVWMVSVLVFAPVIYAKTARKTQAVNSTAIVVLAEETAMQGAETQDATPVVAPTFVDRIQEWFSDNFVEFMSSVNLTAVVGGLAAIVLEKKANKKNTVATNTAIETNTAVMKENTESNDKVLEVVNLLIDGTNELKSCEEIRDMAIAKLTATTQAVLEILVTVYANNKNIPQATKDLVNLKYVTALKEGASKLLESFAVKTEE